MKLEPYLSDEIIPDLNNIVRDIEDEGDRCYLGSTNDADRLREIADWLETKFRRTPPASQSDEALVELLEAADAVMMEYHGGLKAADPRTPAIFPVWTIIRKALAHLHGDEL